MVKRRRLSPCSGTVLRSKHTRQFLRILSRDDRGSVVSSKRRTPLAGGPFVHRGYGFGSRADVVLFPRVTPESRGRLLHALAFTANTESPHFARNCGVPRRSRGDPRIRVSLVRGELLVPDSFICDERL